MQRRNRGDYAIAGCELVAEGADMSVQVLSLAAGQSVPWHYHSEITDSFVCLDGPMLVETRAPRHTYRLLPGERCTVPPKTDRCATEQRVEGFRLARTLVKATDSSNSVTLGPAEIDPVLRAPLPQNRSLGLVRKIVPPFEGAAPHQQILISAVSTSSAEDVANFVVVVG
jgi:mannose-6-phosphate isomerase-like protein (cupin superfamily)